MAVASAVTSTVTGEEEQINIEAESEYRFELDHDQSMELTLKKGTAEVFGTEVSSLIWSSAKRSSFLV